MCQTGIQNQVSIMNNRCDCECGCPILLPIEDEIRKLEEHKKILSARIEDIDKKIASLKSVKE
jgi:hypothetical protein